MRILQVKGQKIWARSMTLFGGFSKVVEYELLKKSYYFSLFLVGSRNFLLFLIGSRNFLSLAVSL